MIPIWAMMLAKHAVKITVKSIQEQAATNRELAAVERARQLKIERGKPCCASCAIEVASRSDFCHSCGSSKFTVRGVILDRITAEQRRVEELKTKEQAEEKARLAFERKERERRTAVRIRCKELLSWRYCELCHATFEKTHKFCTSCGNATSDLPRPFAVEYARQDFPDLIRSEVDFDTFV